MPARSAQIFIFLFMCNWLRQERESVGLCFVYPAKQLLFRQQQPLSRRLLPLLIVNQFLAFPCFQERSDEASLSTPFFLFFPRTWNGFVNNCSSYSDNGFNGIAYSFNICGAKPGSHWTGSKNYLPGATSLLRSFVHQFKLGSVGKWILCLGTKL